MSIDRTTDKTLPQRCLPPAATAEASAATRPNLAAAPHYWRRGRRLTTPQALLILGLLGLFVLVIWLTIRVDLLIFGGVLFGICLHRAADGLHRTTGLGSNWSLAAVALLIVLFFAGIGWFFSQSITAQFDELSIQLPAAATKVADMVRQSSLGKIALRHLDIHAITASPGTLMQNFFGVAANVVEVIGSMVIVVFVAFYSAAEAKRYSKGLVWLVAPAYRPRAAEILHETASAVWYWMLGRLFSMTVLGTVTALGLWLLGVPLAISLGLLAGIMIFVPYIGSIVAAIPAMILGASINLMLAVYVIALYTGVHLVEGYVLVPLVQRRVVHLPPALTLSAQIILTVLAGFLGLLFATPLVAAGVVLTRMIYVEDILGDRGSAPPAPFD